MCHLLAVGHKTELVVLEVRSTPIQHNSVILFLCVSSYFDI